MISRVGISAMGRKGQRERDQKCHREGTVAVSYMVMREGRPPCMQSEQREQPVQLFASGGGWSRVSDRREGQIT